MTNPLAHVKLHYVNSIEDAMELKRWMSVPRPFIAVDTETQGLHWWYQKPRLLQVGDANEAFAIPWDSWGGAIMEIIEQYDGDIVCHNAKFDVHMFEHWTGVTLPKHKIHDTCVLAHIINPSRPVGLKPLAAEHIDRQAVYSERLLKEQMDLHNWGWDTVPLDFQPYWAYAGMDCVLTSRLFEMFKPIVDAQCPESYDLEMAALWTLMAMEKKGIAVDKAYTAQKCESFTNYVDQMTAWCMSEYGVKAGVNMDVIARLQRDTTYEFYKLTEKKKLSLDADVLKDVVDKTGHPLALAVYNRRRVQKICSTYLKKFLVLEHHGRIHPSYNSLKKSDKKQEETGGFGARTSRMSISDPSLQNLPRRENTGMDHPANAVRNCLTATNNGDDHKLVLCDFDQIEMRMMASLSGDSAMIDAFLGPEDFFVQMTRDIFNDQSIVKKDPRRQTTKNAGYAKIYGAGIPQFSVTAGITVEQGMAFMNRMDELYPGMNRFAQEVGRRAQHRFDTEGVPYVKSPLTGRRFPCDSTDKAYVLVNYLIQGTAAEVLKKKDVQLHKAGVGEFLVLNVHDEVILDVPDYLVDEVSRTVRDVMNDYDLFVVPLTAGMDTAPRWGAKGG